MNEKILHILRERLCGSEFRTLMGLTDEGRRLPFGPDGESALEPLLLVADEDTVDLLTKCEHILEQCRLPVEADGSPRAAEERLLFEFEEHAPELAHFLGSLRQNGFATSAVEGQTVTVWVYIEAESDSDFYRKKDMVRSFLEIAKVARGRNLGGRRLY